jgi:energy-coupling factor transporter ATP-binding protein EcfA2
MIKSLTFTGEFGYIVDKIEEPICPVRGYSEKITSSRIRSLSEKEKEQLKRWKKEHKEWEKHKDEYSKPHLAKNLLDRTFHFEPNKINLIFGPNASGKTTILKALGGIAGTTDGYAQLYAPLDVADLCEKATTETFKRKKIQKMMCNSAIVDWDGTPIYYDNFANRKSYGSLGDLSGSVLGDDIVTEIQYIMSKDKISQGQNSIYLMSRLINIARQNLSYKDIFSKYVNDDGTYKPMNVNSSWEAAYKAQLDYYMGFENSFKNLPGTFLFDELDKSLDIVNTCYLYNTVLPQLVETTGVQIIIISHSPIVLSEKIRNNEMYNIISIDEDYTKECIKLLEE